MRILQMVMVFLLSAQLLAQFILFITDAIKINRKNCCDPSYSNTDTIEEVMFVSDFIDSIVSLSSCYFIYVNSNVFTKFKIKFRNPLTTGRIRLWRLPSGKGKFFSRIGIILAYIVILILPVSMVLVFQIQKLKTFAWVNAYIEIFPTLLNATVCPPADESESATATSSKGLLTGDLTEYHILSYAVTLHWHLSPVFACIVVRYLCKDLEYRVEKAIKKTIRYIIDERNRPRTQKNRPIVKYYRLTSKIEEGSRIAHYVATVNIVVVIVILASLFSSYVDSNNRGYTQKFQYIARTHSEISNFSAIRTAFIYIYQFISVWLLSDAIISLNSKLGKFSDSVLADDNIVNILFTSSQENEQFRFEMKQEMEFISQSRVKFEIAFFGDFSISVFHTIIPFGLGAMIDFTVRAIDATKIFWCDKV